MSEKCVCPLFVQLTLVIHPSFYHATSATGAPLPQNASTKIPLLVGAGQQIPPIRFTISGAGR